MYTPAKVSKRINRIFNILFLSLVTMTALVVGLSISNHDISEELKDVKLELSSKKLKKPVVFKLIINNEEVEEVLIEDFDIIEPCSTSSTFKSYMDYRTITAPSSQQKKLQDLATTKDGYRMLDDRYMVAMANFNVGDRLDIVLDTGETLKVIIGDIKANTLCSHPDGSIIEFIVDVNTMDKDVKIMGNYNIIHEGTIDFIKLFK